jgi:hypothetical protein
MNGNLEEVMVKMKNLLVLITLMVEFFGFSAGVFAQLPTVFTCSNTVGRVPCDLSGQTGICAPFDFQTGDGYCTLGKSSYSNKAVFLICNCPDSPANFRAGSTIGVRMTILVNDQDGQKGAYWASSDNIVRLGAYDSPDLACAGTALDSFGPGHFYKTTNLTPTGYITPYTGTNCHVESASQATVYVTDRTAGYTITEADEIYALSRWYVEIPPIRIDPSVLHNGETIKVKVEFLNQAGPGICADCPPVCQGTVTVAEMCCTYTPVKTLTVASFNPYSGVSITVNPSDNSGQGNGTTPFTRAYNNNASVTLTAPSTANGNNFSSWTGCTSTSGATCNVTMNSEKTVKANFRRTYSLPLPPWLLLLFGN